MLQIVFRANFEAIGFDILGRNARDDIYESASDVKHLLGQTYAMHLHTMERKLPRRDRQILGDLQGIAERETFVCSVA